MKRLLIALAFGLCAAPAFAQPATNFPSNVTRPVFVIPASAVNGGGTFPVQLFGPQSCTTPAYSFTSATTSGYGLASSTACVVIGGTQRLGISSSSVTSTVPYLAPAGTTSNVALSVLEANLGIYAPASQRLGFVSNGTQLGEFNFSGPIGGLDLGAKALGFGASFAAVDVSLSRGAAGVVDLKNAANATAYRYFGYVNGSRSTSESIASVTTAVTLSGASTSTGNVIPAGATVVDVATSTTTTITGATGYTVGDGTDADRYGDITGTAVGTNSGSTNYTTDPRWWTNAARAIVLTAKTSNFTGGVVQVTVFYRSATGS